MYRSFLLALSLVILTGCTSWQPAERYEGWTLYERPGGAVSAEAFRAAFEPAFRAVESALGPFRDHVRVHAWNGSVEYSQDGNSRPGDEVDEGVQEESPGIGPARIQAYHARGGNQLFTRSGVFIGVADVGTAVHELVHARLAEEDHDLPLWFEEGLASFLGDGVFVDGRWVIDGLACWPLRELREEHLSDADIERLLAVEASDRASVRENVLVHFLGWAIVFDLLRETGDLDWRELDRRFDADHPIADARRRLTRTLTQTTQETWLQRLEDPDPAVRLACAKGTWKLRSTDVLEALIDRLSVEENAQARVGLAVNALATLGEVRLPPRSFWRAQRAVLAALRDADLEDAVERRAALDLFRSYRYGGGRERAHDALERLERYWRE